MILASKPEKRTLRWLWSNCERSVIFSNQRKATIRCVLCKQKVCTHHIYSICTSLNTSSHLLYTYTYVSATEGLTFPHNGRLKEVATTTIVAELPLVEIHGLAGSLIVQGNCKNKNQYTSQQKVAAVGFNQNDWCFKPAHFL